MTLTFRLAVDARRGRHVDRRLAFGDRRDQARRIDVDDARRRDFVGRLARQVARLAAVVLPGHDELLPGVAARDRHQAVLQAARFDLRSRSAGPDRPGRGPWACCRRRRRQSGRARKAAANSAAKRGAAARRDRMVGSFSNVPSSYVRSITMPGTNLRSIITQRRQRLQANVRGGGGLI